jgi:hypothetical protein
MGSRYSRMPKVSRSAPFPAVFYSAGESHPFLEKHKASLEKRLSLTKMDSLYAEVRLAWLLVALDRTEEAIEIAHFLQSDFTGNHNVWSPTADAICLEARLRRARGEEKERKGLVARVLEHPAVAIMSEADLTKWVKRSEEALASAQANPSQKWAIEEVTTALLRASYFRETAGHGAYYDAWVDVEALETTIETALALARERMEGRIPAAASKARAAGRELAQAREGDLETRVTALRALADKGDRAASFDLAKIFAFRGAWDEAAARATEALARRNAGANAFTECAMIVRRAADVLGRPKLIAEAAAGVPEEGAKERDAVLLADHHRASEAARNPRSKELGDALALAPTLKRFKGKPKELAKHGFALAVVFDVDDEIIARWEEANPLFTFHDAIELARACTRRGDGARAWRAIDSRLALAGGLPVELVTDFRLAPLMTPERCAEVLARCG